MKILITGITGFAGLNLYKNLSSENHEIIGFDRILNHSEHFNNAHIIKCDINDYGTIAEVLKKFQPDHIYHFAAFVHVGRTEINPTELFETNVAGTVNLFEAVRNTCPDARVLVTGSAEEYGAINHKMMPIREEYSLNPRNLYGLSKKFQEQSAKYYQETYGLDIVFTRTFHYFGPYQPRGFVCADFASQIIEIEQSGKDSINVGNLKAARDFIDIRDAIAAYRYIMDKGKTGEIYNVCSASAVSIESILEKFLSYAAKKIIINVDHEKLRPLDVPVFVGDNKKLTSLGWTQNFTLEESIEDVIIYWRNNKMEMPDKQSQRSHFDSYNNNMVINGSK